MKTIHHATVKKAEKAGFTFDSPEDEPAYTIRWPERNRFLIGTDAAQLVKDMAILKTIVLEYPGVKVLQIEDGSVTLTAGDDEFTGDTLEAAWDDLTEAEVDLDSLEPVEDDADPDDADADEDEGRSVIKRVYKRRYRPHKNKNGDEIGRLVSDHVRAEEEGDDGRPRIDPEKLQRFAEANGCWQPNYAMLNVGMQRMNVVNRLRAKMRKEIAPVWA